MIREAARGRPLLPAPSGSAARLAVQLEEWFRRDGIDLERQLGADFWNRPLKGDLAEAFGRLTPASGPVTALARRATLEGLWAYLRDDPTRSGFRRYFRELAPERARRLATAAATASRAAGTVVPRGGEVPGGLGRLRGGEALLRTYVRDVRMEFRRQQASFDNWAHTTGLLQLATGHAGHGGDPLLGWRPGFRVAAILPDHHATVNAAGQHALDTLYAEAARRRAARAAGLEAVPDFNLTDPTLSAQVDSLLFDQVSGIDETTAAGLRQVLQDGAGKTVAELGQDVSDYWDRADLVRGITIAATEMARASAWAELATYNHNGVKEVEFSGGSSGDICDEYLGQVYPADDPGTESIIPVHPRCTHYFSPVLDPSWGLPDLAWAGGDVGEYTSLMEGAEEGDVGDLVAGLPGYVAGDGWKIPEELAQFLKGIGGRQAFLDIVDGAVTRQHVEEMAKVPAKLLKKLDQNGVRTFVDGDKYVTDIDAMQVLKGVQPRGYPAGETWDRVSGLYSGSTKGVIVGNPDRSGSISTMLHELGHAADWNLEAKLGKILSYDPEFAGIWRDIQHHLKSYYNMVGQATMAAAREEFLAETFAHYWMGEGRLLPLRAGATSTLEDIDKVNAVNRRLRRLFNKWFRKYAGPGGLPRPDLMRSRLDFGQPGLEVRVVGADLDGAVADQPVRALGALGDQQVPVRESPRQALSHAESVRILAGWRAGLRAVAERTHTGAMVALYLPPGVAEQLAVPGYEPADELHLTLAYLGKADQLSALQVAAIETATLQAAAGARPLRATVSGLGRFTNVPKGSPEVVWAALDVPGLDELRVRLVGWLVELGVEPDRTHGFTPHVTLAYVEPGVEPVDDVPDLEFTFDRLTTAIAGRRTDYALGGDDE